MNTKFLIATLLTLFASTASFAASPHSSSETSTQVTSVSSSTSTQLGGSSRRHGSAPGTPNAQAFLVPYTCGSGVSAVFSQGALIIQSDENSDAGFEVYPSQSSPNTPFSISELDLNVAGVQKGDLLTISGIGLDGSITPLIALKIFDRSTYNLSFHTANANTFLRVLGTFKTSGSTIVLSNVKGNGESLPFDLTQTAHCASN